MESPGILNFLTEKGKWLPLYVAYLRNRLRRDKNLSDVENKKDARGNLELLNEVTDHWHDTRYVPMIDAVKTALNTAKQKLTDLINNLEKQHKSDTDSLRNLISQNSTSINNLNTQMASVNSTITKMSSTLNTVKSDLDIAKRDITNIKTTHTQDINALSARITTNTNSISSLNSTVVSHATRIGDAESSIATLNTRLGTAESKISKHTTDISNANKNISSNTDRIATLENGVATIKSNLNTYALKTDLNAQKARLDGKEFVKNGTIDKNISLKYEVENGKNVVAPYVDGVKVPVFVGDTPEFNDEGSYYRFPNGLIFQWGHIYKHDWSEGYSGSPVTFPIPFPNKCLSVTVTSVRDCRGDCGYNHINSLTNTSFKAIVEQNPDGWSNGYWFAIGY